MQEHTTLSIGQPDLALLKSLEEVHRPCLILYSGSEPGRRYELEVGELILGRGQEADLVVDGRGISRRHAAIRVTSAGVELRDLGSANCTYVNSQRVVEPVRLKDGDLVRLADALLRFHDRGSLDAVLHERLYRLATLDGGTGLFNRRYLQESLKVEFARARRHGHPLALLCCDLDHFKAVNDSFGHPAGDAVLRDCAELLRAEMRAGDVAGRWGGEEFIVLVPNANDEQALALAERLRSAVATHGFELDAPADGQPPRRVQHHQTMSIGVVTIDDAMRDEHDLMAEADRRLYAAKRNGRNRVWSGPVA